MAKAETNRTDAPPRTLSLPYKRTRVRETYIAPDDRKRAKHIALSSNDTLQYIAEPEAQETLDTIEVGDLILVELKNGGLLDAMAYNAVVVRREHVEAVGVAAEAMVSNPDAISYAYVPSQEETVRGKILGHSQLVYPGQTKEFLFAPTEKGEYTILCTFPGHWRLMQLHFTVR